MRSSKHTAMVRLKKNRVKAEFNYLSPEIEFCLKYDKYISYDYYLDDSGSLSKDEIFTKLDDLFLGDLFTPILISYEGLCFLWEHNAPLNINTNLPFLKLLLPLEAESNNISKTEALNINFDYGNINASDFFKLKSDIQKGRIYQANLTESTKLQSLTKLWPDLAGEKARYKCSWIDDTGFHLLGLSPEMFLEFDKGKKLTTKPIKGTSDIILDPIGTKLKDDEKNASEHVMIVDLCRNDLVSSCEKSSVEVPYLKELVRGFGLWHLESVITAKPKEQTTLSDVLKTIGPGGSVTGAPKLEAVKVIYELEKGPRNFYTGLSGIIGKGKLYSSMPIRTIYGDFKQSYFHVGGGIVYDSEYNSERLERNTKSKPILNLFKKKSKSSTRPNEQV